MKQVLLFESQEQLKKTIHVGEKRLVRAAGKSICLVRTEKKLIAFLDECPHMSESLYSGHLNIRNEIVCPWHSYRFNILSGDEVERRCSNLRFVEILTEDEKVFLILTDT